VTSSDPSDWKNLLINWLTNYPNIDGSYLAQDYFFLDSSSSLSLIAFMILLGSEIRWKDMKMMTLLSSVTSALGSTLFVSTWSSVLWLKRSFHCESPEWSPQNILFGSEWIIGRIDYNFQRVDHQFGKWILASK